MKRNLSLAAVIAAAMSVSAETGKNETLWREFVYDKPDMTPIFYGGESRAQDVHASDYCIYLDIYHPDGSATWAERADFTQGTHDWEKMMGALIPKKPVSKIQVYAVCRNGKNVDKAEFRNFFLERREGKGERIHERRRSNRPLSNEDVVYYERFEGRKRTLCRELVPAADDFGASSLKPGTAAVWTASSLEKVSPLRFPSEHELAATPRVDYDIARRGSASAQVLVSTATDVEWSDATLRLSGLTDRKGRKFGGRFEWRRVGYIPRETFIMPHPLSPDPRENWIPDPLLPAGPFKVRKGSTQALWVSVHADSDAEAGIYFGEIEVVEGGEIKSRVSVTVKVRDFSLPETFGLDTSFALMDGFLRRTYPENWKAMRRQAQDILLDHRLNPDDITRTSLPDLDDLEHARKRGASAFTILNIAPEPRDPNQLWTCFPSMESVFNDSFYPSFKARIAPYCEELKKRGLYRYARLYGFDEREKEYFPGMMALWKKIKADFPDLPVLTSAYVYRDASKRWSDYKAGKADLEGYWGADIFCPCSDQWNKELTDYLHDKGRKVFWYTCCGPRWPYANFASYEFPQIEARLVIGFQTHVSQADGFLFWHVNNWKGEGNQPFDVCDTFLPDWSTRNSLRCPGDGTFLYPSKNGVVPSIRLALLRDGVQDYEWLAMAEKKRGRKAVDAVSRRLVRSLKDFTRDPAAVRDAHGEIGDMIDGGASRRIAGVPDRHLPKRIMGRDYWPALYKFGDWLPRRNWKASTSAVRFDNPAIFEIPAFRDFAPVYWARRNPPPYDSGKGTWRKVADNFTDNEPDREIIDSNPTPEKPFLFAATGKRQFQTWGMEIDLDHEDFAKWKAAHPNALYDGMVCEWDNDLMMSYGRVMTRITNEAHRATVRKVIGEDPKNRYERMAAMRRMYYDRKRAAYDGTMAAHTSNVLSMHLGADCGAAIVSTEMTNTSGSPANDTEYRWNIAPFFVRGAARQFGIPWEWYWAQYMNGFRHTGEWHNNAVCEYPAVKKKLPAVMNHGPEFGTSSSLMRRLYYFSYLNGANVTQPEEWSAYFLSWDERQGKTVLTGRGRDYARFHDFTQANPDRGAPYTPVAVCVPLSRGYTAYGGWAWASDEFKYTKSDLMSDAVFFSLVPGFERAKAMKKGVETCLHNSKFAQMYDVVCPDVPSQSEDTIVDVLKSYRAVIVAGEFDDPKAERAIEKYGRGGGRVVRLPVETFPKLSSALPGKLKSGKVAFPEVEKLLAGLEADYFPFKVEGDCLYGANRTEKGWWLWVFNNRGVTKFTDLPHTVDHAFDADVRVSGSKCRVRTVREIMSGRELKVSGDSFACSVKAGDLAVFEISCSR